MRLIDADKMILRYQSHPNRHSKDYLTCITYEDVIDAVIYDLEQETSVDAVTVVRCKDCVCGEERVDKNRLTYLFCTFAQHPTVKHNYCVWGKKRRDDE